MEQAKKNLKQYSILVLIFAGLSLIRIIVSAINGATMTDNLQTEQLTKTLVKVALIISLVISVIVLIPQVFIGIKGIKLSNAPDKSTSHIFWAKFILVIAIISLVSNVLSFNQSNILMSVVNIIASAVDVVVFFFYMKSANAVLDKCE